MPNVLSPRDLVSRPDNMDETVPHTKFKGKSVMGIFLSFFSFFFFFFFLFFRSK